MTQSAYLNLGCGAHAHPEWVNIDIAGFGPYMLVHDLRKGIPFPDATFDVVYHSHLLEHLPRQAAPGLLADCFRVTRPGGVVRVAVPDLEQIVKAYLRSLEGAAQGDAGCQADHEWMMLELYDQTVRERPGGAMLEYLRRPDLPNEAFVCERLGDEARGIIAALRRSADAPDGGAGEDPGRRRRIMAGIRGAGRSLRLLALRKLLGPEGYAAWQSGTFRAGGEVHQWMYDCHSLASLLRQAGYVDPVRRQAWESAVPEWTRFALDTRPDGAIRKPDSLYMEATRPQA